MSRYEEYRGFTIQGQYRTTNPAVIDVFFTDDNHIGQTGDFTAANTRIEVHQVNAGEFATDQHRIFRRMETFTIINPNKGFATIARQGVIRVTKAETSTNAPGESLFSTVREAGIVKLDVPASNHSTKVWVAWFHRSITTSALVNNATVIIPVNEAEARDDAKDTWQRNGRIRLDDEEMTIIDYNALALARPTGRALTEPNRSVRLAAPAMRAQTTIIIDIPRGTSWHYPGWGKLSGPDEYIVWDGLHVRDANTTLTQELAEDRTATTFRVADQAGFTPGETEYIYVDDEIMRFTGGADDTFQVERAQLGTRLQMHANGANVRQRSSLTGVRRGQANSADVNHNANVDLISTRGFLVGRGNMPVQHRVGSRINYFYSNAQRDAAIRMTFAHEAGHSLSLKHEDNTPCIMKTFMIQGSIDGNGINHIFSNVHLARVRVRNAE